MERQVVWQFIHHFLTHSTVWEVYETDYPSMESVPEKLQSVMFTGADQKVYMTNWPRMASRKEAVSYIRADGDKYFRYEVIEISN